MGLKGVNVPFLFVKAWIKGLGEGASCLWAGGGFMVED